MEIESSLSETKTIARAAHGVIHALIGFRVRIRTLLTAGLDVDFCTPTRSRAAVSGDARSRSWSRLMVWYVPPADAGFSPLK